MRNYIEEGICLTFVATAPMKSGDLVIEGSIVGVAAHDAEVGQDATIRIEGVFELPKTAALGLVFGQPVTWAAGAVAGSGGNAIGVAAAPADAAATTAYVLLGYHGGAVLTRMEPESEKKAAVATKK